MRRCDTRWGFFAKRHQSHLNSGRAVQTHTHAPSQLTKHLSNTDLLGRLERSKAETTPTPIHDSVEDGLSDQKIRLHVAPLPQSPLTEPGLTAARARYRKEKPLPNKERSVFQLKLEKNPYGMLTS